MSFGTTLRLLRVGAGLKLRELAERVGVSSAYLSRVENDIDAEPTPDRLARIADALGLPRATLFELARQTSSALDGYFLRTPSAAALALELAERNYGPAEIARIEAFIERELPAGGRRPRSGPRVSDLLDPSRVVLKLTCPDLESLVGVAVTRLPIRPPLDMHALAAGILQREEHAASELGHGLMAPHLVKRGLPSSAALVTMRRPLTTSVAHEAVTAAVVFTSTVGAPHLGLLAGLARLASRGLADDLSRASSIHGAIECIRALESLW